MILALTIALLIGSAVYLIQQRGLVRIVLGMMAFGHGANLMLLATGVVNHRPPVDEDTHADAVARGLLRYCPICDAYEQTGTRIGVLGGDRHALAEAGHCASSAVAGASSSLDDDDDAGSSSIVGGRGRRS